jgi:hypothetical protein
MPAVRPTDVDVANTPPERVAKAAPPPVKRVTFTGTVLPADNGPGAPRSIMKAQAPRARRQDIELYMPPKTREDAELLLRGLGALVADGKLERFSSRRNLLLDSILAGAELIPQYERWEFVVLSLLDSYKQLLFLVIHQLFKIFDFDALLVACACQTFTFSELIDRFRKLPRQQQCLSLRFVVLAIQTGIDFTLTDEQKQYIIALTANCPEGRSLVDDYLKLLENPVPALVEKITAETECDFEFRLLVSAPRSAPALEPALIKFMASGTAWQKEVAVYIASHFPPGTFKTLTDSILALQGEEREGATEPVLKLLGVDFVLEELLTRLKTVDIGEQKCGAALSLVHRYVQAVPPKRCAQIVERVMGAVHGIIAGDAVALRRLVLAICVEFNMRIPDEFSRHLKQIPTNHQRMIGLYCSRKKK